MFGPHASVVKKKKQPIRYLNHIKELHECTASFFMSTRFADVTLILNGHRFPCHHFVLVSRSKYFENLLPVGPDGLTKNEIQLEGMNTQAFKDVLKYMYTSRMTLLGRPEKDLFEILNASRLLQLEDLLEELTRYLPTIMRIQNACWMMECARSYSFDHLTNSCLEFIDSNAYDILKGDHFFNLNATSLAKLIDRDSFCAPEVDIFMAVTRWAKENPEEDVTEVLDNLRFVLITKRQLKYIVLKSELSMPLVVAETMEIKSRMRQSDVPYRNGIKLNVNVLNPQFGGKIFPVSDPPAIKFNRNDFPDIADLYTVHSINRHSKSYVVLQINEMFLLNHLKMHLYNEVKDFYSYYVEARVGKDNWKMIVDYRLYDCRGWQNLYFEPIRTNTIRIVGTNSSFRYTFAVGFIECMYTSDSERTVNGIVVPTQNVATAEFSASVVDEYEELRNEIIDGEMNIYISNKRPSKIITIRLGQPYVIDSMRFLLNYSDGQLYSYHVEVSSKEKLWLRVADRRSETHSSWQTVILKPREVTYIRITCLSSTAFNQELQIIHFECPIKEKRSDDDSDESFGSMKRKWRDDSFSTEDEI